MGLDSENLDSNHHDGVDASILIEIARDPGTPLHTAMWTKDALMNALMNQCLGAAHIVLLTALQLKFEPVGVAAP